jgi:hypothetical protein
MSLAPAIALALLVVGFAYAMSHPPKRPDGW